MARHQKTPFRKRDYFLNLSTIRGLSLKSLLLLKHITFDYVNCNVVIQVPSSSKVDISDSTVFPL